MDEFSSDSNISTSYSADGGSAISGSFVMGPNGDAVLMNYSFGSGSWVLGQRDYSYRGFSTEGGNAVRFRCKSDGNNMVEIKFTDYDSTDSTKSDKLDLKFQANPDNQWKTYTVCFASFNVFNDGNSSFDLSKVQKMAFGVTQEAGSRVSANFWMDKIELYKTTYTLVDDFNDQSDPNFFGGVSSAFGGNPEASRQYIGDGINKSMKFTYNVSGANEYAYATFGLSNKNFQGYTHLYFKIRGNAGGEWGKIKLETPLAQSAEVFISTFLVGGGTITTSYQDVFISTSSFTGISFSSITKITMIAGNAFGSGAGTVYVDDLAFVRRNETSGAIRALDELDTDPSLTNWESYTHDDSTLKVSAVSDRSDSDSKADNRVYKLEYAFNATPKKPAETPYSILERPFHISVAPYSALRFQFKGTGSENNVEFKLTDYDNTVWYKKFLAASNTADVWKSATVPLNQLTFFSTGDDAVLNTKRIKKIEFAVSKSAGGSGTFGVDSVEGLDLNEFQINEPGKLVSSFRMVNNPFSPNGDGIREEAYFVYTLSIQSKVTLTVFTLEGDEVRKVASADQNAGEQSLSWNGFDNDGNRVRNGLYIYRLEAEGIDNRKEVIRQVVAVLR